MSRLLDLPVELIYDILDFIPINNAPKSQRERLQAQEYMGTMSKLSRTCKVLRLLCLPRLYKFIPLDCPEATGPLLRTLVQNPDLASLVRHLAIGFDPEAMFIPNGVSVRWRGSIPVLLRLELKPLPRFLWDVLESQTPPWDSLTNILSLLLCVTGSLERLTIRLWNDDLITHYPRLGGVLSYNTNCYDKVEAFITAASARPEGFLVLSQLQHLKMDMPLLERYPHIRPPLMLI